MKWEDIEKEFKVIDDHCAALACAKDHDYGSAWVYFRVSTILELILAKVLRSINLNDLGEEKAHVPDKIIDELTDIINYCKFGLMKLEGVEGANCKW